jgi:hypothetical protein
VSNYRFSDGNWHHVAVVLDAAALTKTYYVDGVLDSTYAFTTLPHIDLSNLLLGSWFVNGAYRSYDGSLDDLAIFTRALTATEISNLFTGNW